jgi:hypothetical protein
MNFGIRVEPARMLNRRTKLRITGEQALASGDEWRAFLTYRELEQLEPDEVLWAKRAAEAARKAGALEEAANAFRRAGVVYERTGFAAHAKAMRRLAEQLGAKA